VILGLIYTKIVIMSGIILRHLRLSYNQKREQPNKRIIKRRPPRSKIQIYGDLLRILEGEANSKKILLTRIQRKIDVPFDRLKKYVVELQMLALIESEKTLKLTKKGKQYIQEYGIIVESIQNMCKVITEAPKTET
jgi:predicted transcriptional regulator